MNNEHENRQNYGLNFILGIITGVLILILQKL